MTNDDPDLLQVVGERLRAARLKKGLTQIEVAEKADLNSGYYSRVERGEANLSVITLKQIVKVLGVKAKNILPF